MTMTLPTVCATRYVQPLREGGSLPAIVDTDDGLFVVKFRGAGQGVKALVAELIVGGLAEAVGLPIPALALVDVPPPFGKNEPDPEIRELLRASNGINVGLRYLDGAFNFDGNAAGDLLPTSLIASLVWFDMFVMNPDRTHHNPNLLVWHRAPWLIDHGAALYMHHNWDGFTAERATTAFPRIRDHMLLTHGHATPEALADADTRSVALLTDDVVSDIVQHVPNALFDDPAYARDGVTPTAARARYMEYLLARLRTPRNFVAELVDARTGRLRDPLKPRTARR
jgi:hypothetical protein